MNAPLSDVKDHQAARKPALDRDTSAALAAEAIARFVRQLDELTPADGSRPTMCPGWDVRTMASHVLGMTEMFSSYPRMAKQHLPAARASKGDVVYIDALTSHQVAHRLDLDLPTIASRLSMVAPSNVRWRRRTPTLLRNVSMPPQPVNGSPGAPTEPWSYGYLFDTILTRDTWMHRADISVATGHPLELTRDHDGVIVEQVVTEWASRHDQPYDLVLTGPAGGTWGRGHDGESLHLDAIEFCRVLSGRGRAQGLLAVGVPF